MTSPSVTTALTSHPLIVDKGQIYCPKSFRLPSFFYLVLFQNMLVEKKEHNHDFYKNETIAMHCSLEQKVF